MEPQHLNYDCEGIKFCQIFKRDDKSMSVPSEQIAIILVADGMLSIQSKSGTHVISKGGGFMMKQFCHYSIKKVNDDPFDGMICFVQADTVCNIVRSFEHHEILAGEKTMTEDLRVLQSKNLECYIHSLKLYLPLATTKKDLKIISESKLHELFWILKQAENQDELYAFLRCIYKREKITLDSMLENCYRENINLKNLAMKAGCSISTFKRKFDQLYHTTPGKWIQTRRLEEAYHLIQTTDKTISEICFDVGFENPSHFIQTFKGKFGITPKQLQYKLSAA
jgi:AraC family transcriptional regulator, exoenzyme S synthesis regulatory protein ExsA